MIVATVHRIGARPERFAFPASVRGITRSLPVHHIGGDREHALGVCRVSIGWVLAYLLHEAGNQAGRDQIDAIVVVAELRCGFVTFVLKVDYQSCRVARDTHFSILDRAQTIGNHRKAGDPERHRPQNVAIVQRHLQALVEVLVVHVVDTVHCMHVGAGQPLHGVVELLHDVVVVEEIAGNRQCLGGDLIAGYLIAAAIDRIEQRLGEIDAGAEELHLLAEPHGRDATGDSVVVAPERSHQIVVLVLQRGRVFADLNAVALKGGRHVVRPENRDVRFGRWTEIVERVQHSIAALGHQSASIQIHSADAFGCPIGIAAEQRIIVRRAKESDDAELLHQLVPELLSPRFVQNAVLEIAFDVDVQEGGDAADRHRRAVSFLDRAEICEVGPLERFLRVRGGLCYVMTVELCHRGKIFEGTHLLRQFFALPNDFVGRPHVVDLGSFFALDFEQPIDPVKRHSPVVADDTSAPVGIRKAGDDPGPSGAHDFRGVGVEHAVIVGLAVFREGLVHGRIGSEPGGLQACLDHAQAPVRENCPLERLIGLETHDDLVVAIDKARLVRQQRRGSRCIDRKDPFLPFVREIRLQLGPDCLCALRRSRQKFLAPLIGRNVTDDEIPNVDGGGPIARSKAFPAVARVYFLLSSCASLHGTSPRGCIRIVAPHSAIDPESLRLLTPIFAARALRRLIYVKLPTDENGAIAKVQQSTPNLTSCGPCTSGVTRSSRMRSRCDLSENRACLPPRANVTAWLTG